MDPLFAKALLVGLSIAAPVGPIGLLVIQRSLRDGPALGLATGLGAALADGLYGAIGAFGVSRLIDALSGARVPLALGGGAFLMWLAWRIWQAPTRDDVGLPANRRGAWASMASTFVLTLSNPATIFSFIAVFGTLAAPPAVSAPWTMIGGVLLGSALWWLLLSSVVGRLRHRIGANAMRTVNRLSALLLGGFALWQWALLWRASR